MRLRPPALQLRRTRFTTRASGSAPGSGSYATAADARSCPAMSPTKADDETADEATDGADESNESNETDGPAAELSDQDGQDLERLDIALTTLDDESLRRGLAGITEKHRQDLATQL